MRVEGLASSIHVLVAEHNSRRVIAIIKQASTILVVLVAEHDSSSHDGGPRTWNSVARQGSIEGEGQHVERAGSIREYV